MHNTGTLPRLPRRRRERPSAIAAIDLGTNNCRLLIAMPTRKGGFRVVDSFSRMVRLGEGVAQSGVLAPAAMDRTVDALAVCAERLRRHAPCLLRAIATEACRRAANADVLLARVREEAGIELDIITTEEEARLATVGCMPLLGADYDGALLFDIGGGSTELVWLHANSAKPVYSASVATGVVSLAETLGKGADLVSLFEAVMPLLSAVAHEMASVREFVPSRHHLLGTSGTVTTLAALAMGLKRYDRDKVDASWHACTDILAVVDRLAALDIPARARLGCVGLGRADLVLAGCAIFSAIHALWPCAELRVADRGLREGILRELMADLTDQV